MNFTSKKLLAAALLAAIPMGGAMACTTDNWSAETANALAGNPKGRSAEPAVPRYSGGCGLKADGAGTSYVTDNSPSNDGIYRARFYVFTGSATGNPKIFSATADDNGAGAEAFSVSITGTALSFSVNGTTVATTVPVVASKWYGVEVFYDAGGVFTAKVRGNRALTETVATSAGNAGATLVGSARLGVITAAANATSLAFDAFESTRSDTTEIGRLCPGDANGNGSISGTDATAVANEFPSNGTYAAGQPDCTEDGGVTGSDATCIANRFAIVAQRNCTQK